MDYINFMEIKQCGRNLCNLRKMQNVRTLLLQFFVEFKKAKEIKELEVLGFSKYAFFSIIKAEQYNKNIAGSNKYLVRKN